MSEASFQDVEWMRRALALAQGVIHTTSPNPRVGCVIVRDGQVLGEGATQPPGGPHAEVMALRAAQAAGHALAGATVYVTLEPCSHFGRTPPCADALVAAAPARVVVALGDPNPSVAGKGCARLRAAGIRVTQGVCEEEALALNAGFVARMSRGTPWAWLKLAASLDGRSALHNGASQWITGPQARADGHAWRARADVVLTGIGTVLHDDPRLNVREVATPRQPRKALVDAQLRVSPQARLFDDGPAWVFTAVKDADRTARLAERQAEVICLPDAGGQRVDLAAMMRWLAAQDCNEVHVEAGAGLSGALFEAGCIDALLVYLAPVLLGDAAGMLNLPALHSLEGVRRFAFTDMVPVGGDVRLLARDPVRWQALLDSTRQALARPSL
ncbi:riboflavin biosynthesis protein RibD [Bordetella trematum]|uniref:bifunctional diaminohydroxyphosphoribosylaminopyrimidine deaminase/5-amino-6-(5-phosphoribosylamino)uracil reductase RibD n=1 Tax=Bordetella trematum TaxID=123899 RepID=UPI00046F950B|nr:bifunctional diaminohydroxyphosphoribosylaminopyrimidine deaminase/5-amino-6-(5-phosphoribosylamino)uracil reductase RibD [Bordetella trematum]AUL48483.1 riboflavin biosynthesis protein RibD [Bordetella trematum]